MPPYSRSRTHHRSRRRARRLLVLNLALLAVVLAIGGVLAAGWLGERPFGDGREAAATDTAGGPAREPATEPSGESGVPDGGASEPVPAEEEEAVAGEDEEDGVGTGEADTVTIALVGDLLPAARVAEIMKKEGADYPFREARTLLESADVAAGNLETPITTRGVPAEGKEYVFKGSPEHLQALKDAGFDVLSLANNHTLDQGVEGLLDTMDHLDEAGLRHMGAGVDDAEAYTPVLIERNGMSVAFLGLTRVVPVPEWKAGKNHPGLAEAYDPKRAVAAIERAAELADIVVVLVHWGVEREDYPLPYQKELGRAFIDAGADLVVGSHSHVLQGFEPYKGKWIAYSLGNFVFTTSGHSKSQDTGVLTAECGRDGSCELTFHPMFSERSQPAPMEPEAGRALLAHLQQISFGALVGEDGKISAAGE